MEQIIEISKAEQRNAQKNLNLFVSDGPERVASEEQSFCLFIFNLPTLVQIRIVVYWKKKNAFNCSILLLSENLP